MARVILLWLCLLSACSSLEPRAAHSSYACTQAVKARLPAEWLNTWPDKRLHCVVSTQITRQCSVGEAYLAGISKEIADLFSAGDAEWQDWQADRAGIACGRQHAEQGAITECCQAAGW